MTTTTARTTIIDADLLDELRTRIERANRRAARAGLTGYTLTAAPAPARPVYDETRTLRALDRDGVTIMVDGYGNEVEPEYWVQRTQVTIDGITPVLPGGWAIVGMVELDEFAGPMVRTFDNTRPAVQALDIDAYRDPETWNACDHCHRDRDRGRVYLLMNADDTIARVGSTCVSAFLGIDVRIPDGFIGRMADDLDDLGGMYVGSPAYSIRSILALTIAVIREFGWCSRQQATDRGMGGDWNATSTTDRVKALMTARGWQACQARTSLIESVADEDVDAVVAYAMAMDTDTAYGKNVTQVFAHELASEKNIGIVASVMGGYLRMREQEARRRTAGQSRHVGTVNKREVFRGLTVIYTRPLESDWGAKTLVKFADADGNLFTWFCTAAAGAPDVDTTWDVTATVKKHDEYRDTKQTVITRCKLVAVPA